MPGNIIAKYKNGRFCYKIVENYEKIILYTCILISISL